ncbi:MAG: TIGR02234 family membrane protein [Mycobacterium sp.]|nr:TIGR02234 family membrane protein [Mycobacterium sp.]
MADPQPDRRGRLVIRIGQLLLLVAAGGLWAASRLSWVAIRSFDGLGPPKTATVSGASWSTALLPLALLLVATAIAAVAVRGWPLRMLAVLVAVASLATGYLAVSLWVIPDVAVRAADLANVPVLSMVGSERHYVGAAITLVSAVCALAAAVLLMRSARPGGASVTKYAAPGARRSMMQRDDGAMSERRIWDALDEGRDPTDGPGESAPPRDGQPKLESDTEGR